MTLYRLYLESVDYRSTTMVHVPDLLGCVAVGPTTEAALDAIPEVVNAFRRFLLRAGELVELDDAVDWDVVEHVTGGDRLGYGSPTVLFGPDRRPLTPDEATRLHQRLRQLREEVARWASDQREPVLAADAVVAEGTAGMNPPHGSRPVNAFPGPAGLLTEEKSTYSLIDQQGAFGLPKGAPVTRHALRLVLEAEWARLVELSRRRGGPRL